MRIGLDRLIAADFAPLKGKRVGLVCNQASIDSRYEHILESFHRAHLNGIFELKGIFGPQHGLYGHTQDNMIEWEPGGGWRGIRLHSLYGTHREPTDAMLEGLDLLVVDLQDVGARYYTFIWTAALCIKACTRLGIPVLILDRPNPINGVTVEGPGLLEEYTSFVGLHPVPVRHAMTIGEISTMVAERHYPGAQVSVIECEGWDRNLYLDQTDAPWGMPSPNMPTIDTAVVYPGGCLFEATNLSEGRGTTRPFEIVGAPFLNGERWAKDLQEYQLEGVIFRPLEFQPTFNKHAGKVCSGVFLHVTDRSVFKPVVTALAMIHSAIRQTGVHKVEGVQLDRFATNSPEVDLPGFAWKLPPYEYVEDKMPIDILTGSDKMRFLLEDESFLTIRSETLVESLDC